jgi:lysyl-tRNA synthetase, class II
VVIGASTGGPVALQRVLTKLPANFPLPIVLVQHMPANFTKAFAQRVNDLCAIDVREAVEGDQLRRGLALLAPGWVKELRGERLRKLEELQKLGVNPYPAHAERTHGLAGIATDFDALEGKEVKVAGRIANIRKFGKIAFIVVRDTSGTLQLFLTSTNMQTERGQTDPVNGELVFDDLPLLDIGDFVQANGEVVKTQTGEISVQVRQLFLLTKSLRPLPTYDGFNNKEERLRRRYVDTNANPQVYQRFLRRSAFWQATRSFLNSEGFTEMNIPVLELSSGGADATPFITHMDALDQDFYLRISHELPLKRLLVGGYEKVFDVGPRFRNENYSDEHLPEHVAMEWYWAYADWQMGMELTQRLVRTVADQTWDTRQFKLANGMEIDLGADGQDWPRTSFVEVIKENYGLDVFTCTLDEVKQQMQAHNLEVEKQDNRARGIDKLWKKIRISITGPACLVDVPAFLQPLAKLQPGNSQLTISSTCC